MRRTDFAYDLPVDLIAQHPPAHRAGGRLLHVPKAAPVQDLKFTDFPDLLRAGDLLVFNDTRVIPARVRGVKPTGGQVEILLERVLDANRILAHVHASKPLRPEAPVSLPGGVEARFIQRHDDLFELQLSTEPLAYFEQYGAMPLPPYIERDAEADDAARYQTIYARKPGAVAAPTAGLHFDDEVLARCKSKGVDTTFVTLHVGAGTFQNVRVEDLQQHRMHAERISVSEQACEAIAAAKARGGRVVAVGTTVVRTLESAAQSGTSLVGALQPYEGETRLFITPGYDFRVIDALLTNFHLPESTLLMLVSAFGGFDEVMRAYRHAVEQRYRFFSYGDAMFLERR
ncbi:tRNA preQ1(34) S-adenosylmethionine ribosyltransferase-isomerase QueA [Steroidobacter sp. S1-65]|uniref:S-adenosylmethionine:tRNA ribosyltransferase-isomerase n=1 Tax=Steroidobacter gossypii TaxID=2805490 RepID=A0ABS1WUH2_9GAMM|nr:tRNA preQ1(34) S-adenosylmethionine ribosyltransferase-isomerase QueA [Steroidobacter gossypii]MBM0104603.1 tRNA preQ1(34) S-adenosylmethionine ribosyltransferase-isomerase QueA [Steroidobacter gossypii]